MKHITYFAEEEITKSFREDVLEIELNRRGIAHAYYLQK